MNMPQVRLLPLFAAVATTLAPVCASLNAAVTPTNLVTGLTAPTKTMFTERGNLLVAEAGAGPNTGRISFVDLTTGVRRTVVSGLPSGIAAPNNEPSGPSALLRDNRTVYLSISTGDAVVNGTVQGTTLANARPASPILSSVLAFTFGTPPELMTNEVTLTPADHVALKSGSRLARDIGGGATLTIELIADFDDYVAEPRADEPNHVRASNPFGLALLNGRLFVVDASMNNLRVINLATRTASTLTTFAPLPNTRGMGPPVVESVPDSIRVHGNQLLVTLLSGFPFPLGGAQVLTVDPNTGAYSPLITGLTSAIDVVPVPGGGFLTLEFTKDMLLGAAAGASGRIQWFAAANAAPVIVGDTFANPTRLEFDERTGMVFVTEILAGRIVKFSPWSATSGPSAIPAGQMRSVSVRGNAGSGNETLIAGFTIEPTLRTVLIRGIGARLSDFGVTGTLPDPRITVYDGAGRVVAENDNWSATGDTNATLIGEAAAKVGAFPLVAGSRDAALLRMLPPGAYTVHVSGVGGGAGIALLEVYQVP